MRAEYDFLSWKCFLAVVKRGGVRQAALDVGLEPSNVSRRIRALGEALGSPLVRQNGRALELTEAGEAAVRNFAPIVRSLEAALAGTRPAAGGAARRFHLIAPSGYTMAIVRHAVVRFQRAYPRTHFWLETGRYGEENFENLGKGIDLIVSTIERENAFYVRRELADHRTLCLAAPSLLRAHPIERPEDLASLRLAGNTQFITNQFFEHEQTHERVRLCSDFSLMSDNTYVLLEWAAAGHGVLAGCPHTTAVDYVRQGLLEAVLPRWRLRNNRVYAYAGKKEAAEPETLLALFMDMLCEASETMGKAADRVFAQQGD